MTPYGFDNGGVRHLAAVLKQQGFPVRTIFFKRWMNNNVRPPTIKEIELFLELVRDFDPDIVGIGFGSPYFKIVSDLAYRLRQATDARIVLGGIHPTLEPDKCIRHADIVCIGEGEGPIADLARAVTNGESVEGIRNLWVRSDGRVIRNPLRPLIRDLDSIPFRDFSGEETYVVEDNRVRRGDPLVRAAIVRVHASRGCPFRCGYCYNSCLREIYGGPGNFHRRRSVSNVIEEVRTLRRQLPRIKRVKFDDDTFIFPPAWIDEFVERWPREVGLPFDAMFNPQSFSELETWKLKKAGLDNVQVGIQSASAAEAEDLYERKDPNRNVMRFARFNRHVKLDVVYDIIFDNPLATRDDKEALLDLLLRLPRPYKLYLYSLTYFPKSKVSEEMIQRGIITEKDVEGEATKSFVQFRLSFDWPRPPEDVFYISLAMLMTKRFIPLGLVRWLRKQELFRRHPRPLQLFAQVANMIKMAHIGLIMLRRGELSWIKLKEYGSFRRMLSQ